MIDDMQGLYSHTSDAYRAGQREGRNQFYSRLLTAIGFIGVKHERSGDVSAFRAVEECSAAIRQEKEAADAPQKIV